MLGQRVQRTHTQTLLRTNTAQNPTEVSKPTGKAQTPRSQDTHPPTTLTTTPTIRAPMTPTSPTTPHPK